MIFKTLHDYSAFIMRRPDHPAHEAVRNRLLREQRMRDASLQTPVAGEHQQAKPAASAEVQTTA